MALPDTKKREFDQNVNLSEIREIWFADELGLLLNSNVPTDPGSEVIYKGHPYTMLKAHGTRASIEDPSDGETLEVDLADLKAGRTMHDKSWKRPYSEFECREREAVLIPGLNRRRMPGANCENAGPNGFGAFNAEGNKAGETSLVAHTFAWKANRQEALTGRKGREMVIITRIEDGDRVHFYYCMDGKGELFGDRSEFTPLSDKEDELVMGLHKFRKIRAHVQEPDFSMPDNAIKNSYGGIVYGLGMIKERERQAKAQDAARYAAPGKAGESVAGELARTLSKGDKELAKFDKAAREQIMRKGPTSLGRVGDMNMAKSKDALENENRLGNVTATNTRDGWNRPPSEESSNTVMYAGMAVAALALVYFATK